MFHSRTGVLNNHGFEKVVYGILKTIQHINAYNTEKEPEKKTEKESSNTINNPEVPLPEKESSSSLYNVESSSSIYHHEADDLFRQ